tara:strand:- start:1028 stop:1147 length:120 start_codon:yes stop_codon:yes gene_type:complete
MDTTYTIAICLALGLGFIAGIYICTQISDWINRQIKKDK